MSKSHPRRRGGRRLNLLAALCAALLLPAFNARAQSAPEPRREQLLNGLRIILLPRPGDPEVMLRLRVHSGAAFDLAGKEGMMSFLAGAFFDPNTREYVAEELGGRLLVKTGYDSIDVTLADRSNDFDRMLELLRNGVVNTQLTAEAVERVRAELVKGAGAAPSPAAEAERLVAARLFNPFPYARPVAGTAESLGRVERTDLLLARERFLHPDNSTLVVAGGFEPRRVLRALRQSLGGWRKSDRPVPATFRRPDATDARTLVIDRAGSREVELRIAVRGLARADRDAPAARLLVPIVARRWEAALPPTTGGGGALTIRHDAMREGGIFVLGASLRSAADAARALEAARKVLRELSETGPTAAELDAAKGSVISSLNQGGQGTAGSADSWLDEHTYDTPAVTAPVVARAVNALNVSEVQRVAARLFLHTPIASVAVGDAAQLREELARTGGYEVFGEAAARTQEPAPPKPDKPQPDKPRLELKRP